MAFGLMPTLTMAVFAFASSMAGAAPLNCIAYEPFSNPNYAQGKIVDAITSDLAGIKKQGFECIKTYYSAYLDQNIAQHATNYGLKLVMGVFWMEDHNLLEVQIKAAIEGCNKYSQTIIGIIVGNENLQPGPSVANNILEIRNRLRASGCWQPIGTTQKISYYVDKRNMDMRLLSLDFLGYTIYPFFSTLNGQTTKSVLKSQMGHIRNVYPDIFDKKFIITETGWPSQGGQAPGTGNVASLENAKSYAEVVGKMICSNEISTPWMSYFIFHDPMYKKYVPDFEHYFGVADIYGNPKFDLSSLTCGRRGQGQEEGGTSNNRQACSADTSFLYNTDFPGNDINSEHQTDAKYCCTSCTRINCQSWVWTNYNGGTCWFKSGISATTSLPANLNAVAWKRGFTTSSPSSQLTLPASTSASTPSSTTQVTQPADLGGSSSDYKISAYSPEEANAASSVPGSTTTTPSVSNFTPTCQLIPETDFIGNDIGKVAAAAPQDCFFQCYAQNNCAGFSYFQGYCYLKSSAGQGSAKSNVMSGRIATMTSDTEISGNDLKSIPSGDATRCCGICATTSGCKAATWSNYNGGTCWLKSAYMNITSTPGTKSFNAY